MAAGVFDAARLAEVETAILARAPEHHIAPTLRRITDLMDLLGNPQQAAPVIQITGTNGKTSTARMIDALLCEFGLHTGRSTSPHLTSMRERICLDGAPVEPERFVAAYDEILPYLPLVDARSVEADEVPMTYFEVLTALAYVIFADAPVDVAVVEVGMGGGWDATSVATPAVAVVTPIDVDHTEYLGTTVAQIAAEKAGIIKPDSVAVLAQQPTEAIEPLLRRTVEVGATVAREGAEFGVRSRNLAVGGQMVTLQGLGGVYEDIYLPLHGGHQAANAACALAAVEAFFGAGKDRQLDTEVVRAGFANASSPGRLEVVRTSPMVLLDAAHNPAGARAAAAALAEAFTTSRLIGVVACLADKDALGILEAFEPVFAEVVITASASPRAMDPDALAEIAVDVFGEDRVTVETRLDEAIDRAVDVAEQEGELGSGGVVVTGSIVTVGQARTLLGQK